MLRLRPRELLFSMVFPSEGKMVYTEGIGRINGRDFKRSHFHGVNGRDRKGSEGSVGRTEASLP